MDGITDEELERIILRYVSKLKEDTTNPLNTVIDKQWAEDGNIATPLDNSVNTGTNAGPSRNLA